MYGKFVAFCGRARNYVVSAFALALVALTTVPAHAAGDAVTIAPSGISWSSLPTQIMEELSPALIAGVGIALSIWVVLMGVRTLFRAAHS